MSTILGVNLSRPAPPTPIRVATDFNDWHYRLTIYECIEMEAEKERRLGSSTVPVQCKTLRRRGGGPGAHARGQGPDPEVAEMRSVLVKARVVTAANAELMTKRELRAAMKDLRSRLEACASLGVGIEEDET